MNYPKRHSIKFFVLEARKDEDEVESLVKVYFKYAKTAVVCPATGYDPANEGIELRAYVRQLSANERNEARALQDDSELEVVINKRAVAQDLYMEFNGSTYQIGAVDSFEFEGSELKFRARPVIPAAHDSVEYRSF
jgi:hypothetical protein